MNNQSFNVKENDTFKAVELICDTLDNFSNNILLQVQVQQSGDDTDCKDGIHLKKDCGHKIKRGKSQLARVSWVH